MSPTTGMPPNDVFYCPSCGQKHRGDLSPIKLGGTLKARCAGCGVSLAIEWKDEHAEAREEKGKSKPREAADAPPPEAAKAEPEGAKAEPEATARAAPRTKRDKEKEAKTSVAERELETIVAEFPPGTRIDRYTIEEAIGQGGTGTVYRAFDPTTNRYVAMKFLGEGQSDAMRTRFLREIEVQANLRHPNLMPVFDRGEHGGRPYFTMELLYKPFTLTQIVTMGRSGTLGKYATLRPFDDLATLLRDVYIPVCEGIQVANVENGVVHRDLKPDNILVDSRTLRPYVIDFGICHVLERKTRTGGVALAPTGEDVGIVGTPRFLAPEQVRGSVHERTDVWGLGAILQFCLTGDSPIEASSPITKAELGRRIEALAEAEKAARAEGDAAKADLCAEKLARLKDAGLRTLDDLYKDAREGRYVPLPSGVPAPLAAIVRKALAAKTVERYVNPRSLVADVEAWLSGAQTRAMAEQGGSAASVVQGVQRGLRRSVATAAVALVVGALAFFLGRSAAPRAGGEASITGASRILADLDALERRVDLVGRKASKLTPGDAALMYDVLADALAEERKDVDGMAEGGDRDIARARAAFVADRFAPPRVRVEAPSGVAKVFVEDLIRGGEKAEVAVGEVPLAPGEYRITAGSGVRIPLQIPFVVREPGKAAGREPPRWKVVLPIAPSAIPDGLALVVPGADAVDHRGPPFSAPATVPAPVKPFLMDKREVSNADWLAFLEATQGDAERKAHVPALDFAPDAERPGHFMLAGDASRSKELPVRGITVDDARAFCAWRSKRDGAKVRLPTEAEWVVAAGGLLKYDLPGGARGLAEEGDFAAPVSVLSVKDSSPYGVYGMLGNVREIVTAVRASEGATDEILSKGAGAGDDPSEAAIRKIRPLAKDVRDPRTGLRCVREIP